MYIPALLSLFGSESRRVLRAPFMFRVARVTVFEAGTLGIGYQTMRGKRVKRVWPRSCSCNTCRSYDSIACRVSGDNPAWFRRYDYGFGYDIRTCVFSICCNDVNACVSRLGLGCFFCAARIINYLCIMSASWYCSFPHLSRPLCFFLSSVPRGDRTQVHRLSAGFSSSLAGVLVVIRCVLPGGYASIVPRVCKTVAVRIALVNTW